VIKYTVLVVDDSIFHRRRLKDMIEQDDRLTVIDTASNGKDAISKTVALKPDIITMDVEMPVLDGISAVREIMRVAPTPILMFSSLTRDGARQTLDALDAGALDFLAKEFTNILESENQIGVRLRSKLLTLVRQRHQIRHGSPQSRTLSNNAPKAFIRSQSALLTASKPVDVNIVNSVQKSGKRYQCLAIGASTGGPVALQQVLNELPANFPLPIVLVQHMPGTFTEAFAERLNISSNITVKLAAHKEMMKPGVAYLAPGGRQMQIQGSRNAAVINITDIPDNGTVLYKPSVDYCFTSLAQVYGGDVLSVIMTGMGSDGSEGCKLLKQLGSTVWAQDEASCVVYGMPAAVTKAKTATINIPLTHLANCIKTEIL
jgi:two-component system, chemotaxis family, protein-glutamate methylesterase/glutaminase